MQERIVILGGGFAGVEAAIKLRKKGHEVILVSNRNYLFVYPISIWIPVNKKEFSDVAIPLKKLSYKYGFELIIDEVINIISKENKILLKSQTLSYRYLIVAMGMSKVHTKGLENTHSICGSPHEAIDIKDKLESLIEKGSGKIAIGFGGNPKDSTATAVRGGPAFELIFNFCNYLKKRNVRDNFEITFFAPMEEPGKKMGKGALKKLGLFFKRYDIESKTGVKIKEFTNGLVKFADGSTLESDLILFIPGGSGHEIIQESDLPTNVAGFINIDDNCKVSGIENVYAIGDISALQGPSWAAKQGHIAEVMAEVTAYNIDNQIQKNDSRKGYKKHLNIICVMDTGNGAAFVYRKSNLSLMIPLPYLGHWLKKAWGYYYINSKLGKLPRIPGM